MILGVILARGGSRRLPRKNILPFCGKPLVAWTIEAAKKAELFDRLVVSTEDGEIAYVAQQYGAEVIIRPPDLAADTTSSYEALRHALSEVGLVDHVVLLQPTSPLRTDHDIKSAWWMYIGYQNDRKRPVVSCGYSGTANGAIYIGSYTWLTSGGNWDNDAPLRYLMPISRSQDIDTLEDFERAEAIMKAAA